MKRRIAAGVSAAMLTAYFPAAAAEALTFEIDVFGTVEPEEAEDVFAEMKASLAEESLNGLMCIDQTGVRVEGSAAEEGETADMLITYTRNTEREHAEISAPESATVLRNAVKNAAIICYSIMLQEETAAKQTGF